MHILSNLYPWVLPRRNSELRTHLNLRGLSAIYPDIRVSLASSVPAAAAGNAVWLAQYALERLPGGRRLLCHSYAYHAATSLNWLPRPLLGRLHPDVLFGHEYVPFNLTSRDLPIVYETGLLTGELVRRYRPFYSEKETRAHLELNLRLKRRAIERATLVNFREPFGARAMQSLLPEAAHKVRVIPPFFDYITPLSLEQVTAKHAAEGPVKLLFVGNDARRKGLPALLAAIRRLPGRTASQLEVTVVSQFLDGAVDTGGIGARVVSGGRITAAEVFGRPREVFQQGPLTVSAVMDLMAESHIFALPTLADTFGFVFLEAMANGCAVLGPAREPQTWILDEGRAGMLADPTDEAALAGALMALVENREWRRELAVGGWRRYRETYSAQVVAAQYRRLFEEAIEIGRGGGVPRAA